jgi:hypothetical protein
MEEVEQSRRLLSDEELPSIASGDYQFLEEYINYKYISPISGNQHEVRVKVTLQGDPTSPASFLTMHDMGMTCKLTHVTCVRVNPKPQGHHVTLPLSYIR